jgi:hypothetical protein
MDLKLPITIVDELSESIITSKGILDLASGEISQVIYEEYDVNHFGWPVQNKAYEFTCGTLSNGGRELEFRIEAHVVNGTYSVTPSELLELKGRAAKLFST